MHQFLSSFFGKLLAALFIAVCIALGFGPDEWAGLLTGLQSSIWLLAARVSFIGVAVALVWRGFLAPAVAAATIIFPWQFRPEDSDLMPIRRMISFAEAVAFANEKFRGRTPEQQKITAMMADRDWGSKRDPLGWFGTAIKGRGEIIAFGRRPPSTKIEIIPQSLWEHCHLLDGANSIASSYAGEPQYVDIIIKRVDFKKRLKEIKSWDTEDT